MVGVVQVEGFRISGVLLWYLESNTPENPIPSYLSEGKLEPVDTYVQLGGCDFGLDLKPKIY